MIFKRLFYSYLISISLNVFDFRSFYRKIFPHHLNCSLLIFILYKNFHNISFNFSILLKVRSNADFNNVVKRLDSNPPEPIEGVEDRKRNARPFSPILIAPVDVAWDFIFVCERERRRKGRTRPAFARHTHTHMACYKNLPRSTGSGLQTVNVSSFADRGPLFLSPSRGIHR